MRHLSFAALVIFLCACKTAPTTRETANLMTEAEKTQNKIDRAAELAGDIKNARTPEAKTSAIQKYMAASETALASAETTIENLKKALINSETTRGAVQQKLDACQIDAGIYSWLKWFLIVGGPFVIAGAFFAGRKFG